MEPIEPIEPNESSLVPAPPPAGIPQTTGTKTIDVNPRANASTWSSTTVVGAAGALAGITIVLMFSWLRADAPTESAPATAPSPAPVAVETVPAPTWTGRRQAGWARDGSKTISFDLQAIRDVPIWMSRARPTLSVRCLYRTTEVFVATGSPASIESQPSTHTVRVQIDDDPEQSQQWMDSESSKELFAPNGVALVRQLAGAKRMRFAFTPYNAEPVTAEFAVAGFEKLAGLVASTCGWKLDTGAAAPRAARLN